ncbi:SAUR auxin-responsive family protein [Hibiscus syriacus]|uniref:SAUR auxin-responsive family protein n=1 Tax=Hibiscus syriacus TaxID=106335 RepID=A0A6A3BRA0_HIBSY|nr:auxin-responsive protein SAUR68-like [Hibiscus syriacus]KAE8719163.1 SAUR auxin-responsive family protein [Hibiscus syriacus]
MEARSMITSKKLIKMTRKWQKIATIGRKRMALTRTKKNMAAANHSNKSSVVDNGCFAIYTMDKRRFAIPLAFLRNCIFRELLKMSEEEFGLPSDGPITLPCDSVLMNYIVSLVKRGLAKEMERAVLDSIATYRCSSSPDSFFSQGHGDQESTCLLILSEYAQSCK